MKHIMNSKAAIDSSKRRGESSLRIPQGGKPFSFVQDKQSRTADSPVLWAELKLRPCILCLVFLAGLLCAASAAAGDLTMESSQVDSIIMRGMDLVHADSTDQAVDEFKKLIDIFPNDPIGYFYVSASIQTMMDDYRNYSYQDEFNKYMDLAIKTAEAKSKQKHLTAEDYLYLGGAVGYRGIHKALTGNWPGAFVDGLKAKGYLEDALKLDPKLYDVYYGLGSYHFWKSLKSRIFWWLPFVADNRQMGIDMIKLAIEKGKFSRDDAQLALARIWVENKEYDKAFAQIKMLQKKHLEKPYLLWLLGQAQRDNQMYDGAIQTYQQLLEVLKSSSYYAPAGEVECRYDLALTYYDKRDLDHALAQVDSILTFERLAKSDKNIKDFVGKAKDLLKKIQKEAGTD
jgi:tetratricopeptide (TPR) repeat protein